MKLKTLLFAVSCFTLSQTASAGLPLTNHITAQAKAELTDKVLSKDEIMQGADRTERLYFSCLTETAQTLNTSFENMDKEILADTVTATCEYPEDLFSIYNILISAAAQNNLMSEKQASVYLEKAYKSQGREKANQTIRIKIYHFLQIS